MPVGAGQPLPNLSGVDTDELLINQWLQLRASKHTQVAYATDVRDFLSFAGSPQLRAITLQDLTDWEAALIDQGRAVSTVNRKLASIRSLLTHGQRTGYLAFNVGAAIRPRTEPDRSAERILSERDTLNLLAATSRGRQGQRNQALLTMLYYTGARVSELLGLRWRDLQLDPDPGANAVVALHGKGGRTRHVGLPNTCIKALRQMGNWRRQGSTRFRYPHGAPDVCYRGL